MACENNGFFVNQFENVSNFDAHFETTGPEIYCQTNGSLDAFVMSAGTGGTIAGVSKWVFPLLFFLFYKFNMCLIDIWSR